jgi:hypothetical protein
VSTKRQLSLTALAAATCFLGVMTIPPAARSSSPLKLKPCLHQKIPARCGTLMVPLNRARAGGRKIGINVVVIPAIQRPVAPDAFDSGTAIDFSFLGHMASASQHALNQLAERCSANSGCRKAFPHWRAQFSGLVRSWDAHPAQVAKNRIVTGADLGEAVREMLFDTNNASSVPLVVSRAAAGNYGPLNKWITLEGPPSPEWPMHWSIWCNEPFVGLDAHGPWHTDFDSDVTHLLSFFRSVCAGVPKRAEPASAWTLPHSRVPTLVLAGGADPQDPITNFPQLKEMFPNNRTIVVPYQGHWVARYGCLADVIGRFVARASATGLDTTCVGEIHPPPFAFR